ncbi:PD-(D/E)XK nuclease family protein [Kaistia terrae]|uniref:PD-(D/E)XK nuclease family protein n=1 Tax=Kaistia terrae TaxID=537017 RepID=A0ABW0PYB6_9HYPH|nr:PD-(D/E)XK nuclease family protein [Kaistia terrae]MCX5580793.1 PD-(D/E)XK nuclease family protein [Kaistia terrae]
MEAARHAPIAHHVEAITPARLTTALGNLAPMLGRTRQQGDAVDIWSVAGLGHNEVRNSRVLTWLLDPHGSHGAGDAYLVELWDRISGTTKAGFPMRGIQRVVRENYPIGNGEHRIDIEITGAEFVIFLEVKVNAGETKSGQIEQYGKLAKIKADSLGKQHHAVMYLSETPPAAPSKCIPLRWKDVARSIQSVARHREPDALSTRLALLFAAHVSRFH